MQTDDKKRRSGAGIPTDLASDIRENKADTRIKLAVAKGLIPLEPRVLGESLMILATDSNEEVRTHSRQTLHTLPEPVLHFIAESTQMAPALFDTMAHLFSDDSEILQRIVLNQSATNETIDYIASLNSEKALDLISENQVRMINYPQIIDTLLKNSHLSQSTRLRLKIYKNELIEQGVLKVVGDELMGVREGDISPETDDGSFEDEDYEEDDFDEFEDEEDYDEYYDDYEEAWERETYEETLEEVEEEEEEEYLTVAQRIGKLTVAEKLVLARHANKEERSILIRDSNKQVSLSVLKSPKITDGEAEMIARMRNVPEEVLREISNNRDWIKSYNVVLALVGNPKTPVGVALPFINRIQNKDLRDLSNNRNISETIRTAAKRMLTNRQRRTGGKHKF